MDNFSLSGKSNQVFKLLDIKTKRAREAERELKEMEFDRMVSKGTDDPFDLKYLNKPAREVRPCLIYPLMMCEYGLEEPCTDCPHWNEIDGE